MNKKTSSFFFFLQKKAHYLNTQQKLGFKRLPVLIMTLSLAFKLMHDMLFKFKKNNNNKTI